MLMTEATLSFAGNLEETNDKISREYLNEFSIFYDWLFNFLTTTSTSEWNFFFLNFKFSRSANRGACLETTYRASNKTSFNSIAMVIVQLR